MDDPLKKPISLSKQWGPLLLLRDIMDSDVEVVRMDDSLDSVLDRSAIQEDSYLIVVAGESVVGVVPTTVLKRGKSQRNGLTVVDIMTLQFTTARPSDSIRDGFLRMRKHALSCLPIAERGTIHGFVTFADLFNYMKATKM